MPSPAPTRSASPIDAVRQAADDILALIADLPPEQQLVSLQRAVAKHAARRFPDLAPEFFVHAFGEGDDGTLRHSPEHFSQKSTAPTRGSWLNERANPCPTPWTTQILRPAMEAYLLGNGPLSRSQVAALRAYFRQWIMSPDWPQSPELLRLRSDIEGLIDRTTIDVWVNGMIEIGADPL